MGFLLFTWIVRLLLSSFTPAQSFVVSEVNCSIADEAQNASVTLNWKLFDGDVAYTRISHSSEALLGATSSVSDRLLILGGIEYESAQPVVDSPVLVYNTASNMFLKPQDQILSAVSAAYQPSSIETVFTSPASRAEHASFIDQDGAVFVFGGRSRDFANDTWRGCLDSSSTNVVWDELVTATDATTVAATPSPRIGHSFTKVFENSTMIGALVFGGLSEAYVELSGLHLAFIFKGSSSSAACTNRGPKLVWRMLKAGPLTDNGAVPTARAYHAAMTSSKIFTSLKLKCVILHGGKSAIEGVIFNELWRLCPSVPHVSVPVERMNYTWELLTEIGTTPGARYGASISFVDEGKLALAGGSYTFPSDFLSDTWELNVNATQWIRLSFSEDYTPPRRGHTLSFFSTAARLFLFGGRDRYAVVKKRMQAAYYGAPFCAAGLKITFCIATSKYVCIACPAGSYLESGSRKCLLCPPGTFSSAGSSECTTCPPGTFSTEIGKDSDSPCTSCPSGTFSQAIGAVSSAACNSCIAGTFAVSPGSMSCSSCAAGTFSSANASTCSVCARGKWSGVGAGGCTDCAAGTYAPSTGSTACFSCPRGYFSKTGDVACSACSVNTYSSAVGASASDCHVCPSYAFTTSSGQILCKICSPGSSWTGSMCQLCSKGYYTSTATNGACLACPKGSYTSDSGSTQCQICPTGMFTSGTGATNSSDCQLCAAGSFFNGVACQTCGTGTYPEPRGFCSPCTPGSYYPGGVMSSSLDTSLGCTSCPSMSYSGLGATGCSVCGDRSYSMEGWRSCISCGISQTSLPGCVTGRNGLLCSGKGDCVYGGCACTSGWVGGDCSLPVDNTAMTGAAAVLFFPDAPFQLINALSASAPSDIQVKVARSGTLNSRLQAMITWSSSDFSARPSSLPLILDFSSGESQKIIQISTTQLSPRSGCRFFTLSLKDVTGGAISAVSSDLDRVLTVYLDDINGVSGGVTGRAVTSTYSRQINGTAIAAVVSDRLVSTQVTLSPQTTGVSLRDLPMNLLIAIDFSASYVPSFINLLPAIVAQLQIVYRTIPDGVRLGLVDGTAKPTAAFYSDLVDFFDAVQALAASSVGNAPVDWDYVAAGLAASYQSWPSTDRRHLLIIAGDALVGDGYVTLPSTLLDQLRSQSVFAFILSQTQVTFSNGSDVIKSVAFGTSPAIPVTLRQAFEQKDSALPSSVNLLNDSAKLASSAQVIGFSSGSNSLPVIRVTMEPFPPTAQLQAVTIGVPGGPLLIVSVNEPGHACFPPTQTAPVDSLPLSGWADAWHLASLFDIKRLWKTSAQLAIREDTSLLRKSTSTVLSVCDSVSTQFSLVRTYPGSLFAAGLSLISRGYWKSFDSKTACEILLTMTGTNTSLEVSHKVPFASRVVPGEWNYGFSQIIIPWELSSLIVALKCNTSAPGEVVEWAALGLLPDPDFACKCPRGFYQDSLSDSNDEGRACIRCAAGSYCTAGIKRQCPDGTFSFGKAASCEACRDGWICTDGLARLCDPGTYSTPSFTCKICPSGYACRNGKKYVCPVGTFSLRQASECQSCPPGTISRSEGSSTCELCPLGWTSNHQRGHCVSCLPGEATLYTGQHLCSSCAASAFPIRNQPEVCLE
ncbi:putative ephrin-receptor like [Phytophthora infestans]|uniref:Putative ephrin-receptor like n=1 Tax=Phytophthora infestans TaxID=4787 RepID=A0A8S9UWB6_PHYIN|nr:putative ephrin-receptor like [Phytophthora infestans]